MNIGDRIVISTDSRNTSIGTVCNISTISGIVPVRYMDDGEEEWYEVCDADKTDTMAIVGKDVDNEDVVITINKETCDTSLLLDLL